MSERDGTVVELLPRDLVRVALDGGAYQVVAHLADPVRRNYLRLVVGDRVRVAVMANDPGRGRVTEKVGR